MKKIPMILVVIYVQLITMDMNIICVIEGFISLFKFSTTIE